MITAVYGKDPTDLPWKDDPGFKDFVAFVTKYLSPAQLKRLCCCIRISFRDAEHVGVALASSAAGKRPRWRPPSVVDRQAALTTLDRVPPHDLRKADDPSAVSMGVFLPRPAQLVSGHIGPHTLPLIPD